MHLLQSPLLVPVFALRALAQGAITEGEIALDPTPSSSSTTTVASTLVISPFLASERSIINSSSISSSGTSTSRKVRFPVKRRSSPTLGSISIRIKSTAGHTSVTVLTSFTTSPAAPTKVNHFGLNRVGDSSDSSIASDSSLQSIDSLSIDPIVVPLTSTDIPTSTNSVSSDALTLTSSNESATASASPIGNEVLALDYTISTSPADTDIPFDTPSLISPYTVSSLTTSSTEITTTEMTDPSSVSPSSIVSSTALEAAITPITISSTLDTTSTNFSATDVSSIETNTPDISEAPISVADTVSIEISSATLSGTDISSVDISSTSESLVTETLVPTSTVSGDAMTTLSCQCAQGAAAGMYCGYCSQIVSCEKGNGCWGNAYSCGDNCTDFGMLDSCYNAAGTTEDKANCPFYGK